MVLLNFVETKLKHQRGDIRWSRGHTRQDYVIHSHKLNTHIILVHLGAEGTSCITSFADLPAVREIHVSDFDFCEIIL